ncbi:MAG TPA: hypothetical protein VK453_29180 [Micromonosporaceae bacterium]|nr:hypothetical protein [Micromonosporaceae bacterium]
MRQRTRTAATALAGAVLCCAIVVAYLALRSAGAYPAPITGYRVSADPRVLIVLVEIHPDHRISAVTADEDGPEVVLHITARPPRLWWSGGDDATQREVRVRLAQPVTGRPVTDGRTGSAVPAG